MTVAGDGTAEAPSEVDLDRELRIGDKLDKLENRAA